MVFMTYLLVDLVFWKGPIHQKLRGDDLERSKYENIAARVFAKPVLLSQVDFAVDQKLWAKGMSRSDLSDKQRLFYRQVVLRDLIDQYIFRQKVGTNKADYPVSDEEIDAAVLRFSRRFNGKEDMITALKKYGFKGEKELRYRLAAKLQQDKYLNEKIKVGIAVTDEEAKDFYDKYGDEGEVPESIKVKHIFISRLPAPGQTAEEKKVYALNALNEMMVGLNVKEADVVAFFNTAAMKFSEDERTKNNSGDLGWISRSRITDDFTDKAFAAELNKPTMVETKLGWSIILVTEKKLARKRSFAEMKDEIVIALETHRRKKKIEEYRISMRKQHGDKIRVSWKMLEEPWTDSKPPEN